MSEKQNAEQSQEAQAAGSELKARLGRCPLCGEPSFKAILGIFPVRVCSDEKCGCGWGFWASPAFWLSDHLTPNDGGWWLMTYEGSYFRAVLAMLRGEAA